MFGEKAFELIKELDRSPDNLPPFNVRVNSLANSVFDRLD